MKIRSAQDEFGPFGEHSWLNCAHQGPLPRCAAGAIREATGWKTEPWSMDDEAFWEVPRRVKRAIGLLINVPWEEVILGNSTSHGIHLLTTGIRWKPGDEVLLVRGDFPATILPWLDLQKRGVSVRFLEPAATGLGVDEVSEHLSPATKVFCASWVNSFTGHALDLPGVGEACRKAGVRFVENASQGLGARSLDLQALHLDALSCCGSKWLCGSYGTGFTWIRRDLLASLDVRQVYWLAMQGRGELGHMRDYSYQADLGAPGLDVFGTANFLNFLPWAAAVELQLAFGPRPIEEQDDRLVSSLLEALDREKYRVISPESGPSRSSLVLLTYRDPSRNRAILNGLHGQGIHVALREGNLRISPHFYNTYADVERAAGVLNSY